MIRSILFGIVGAVLGGCIGYAVGPEVPVLGTRLPLSTIMTLGAEQSKLDGVLLGNLASRAGTFFYGGVLLLAATGAALGYATGGRVRSGAQPER